MYGDAFLMCLFSLFLSQFLRRAAREAVLAMLCDSTLLQVPQTCVQVDSGRPRLSGDDRGHNLQKPEDCEP